MGYYFGEEELALKATSEGQEGANHVTSQKSFSGRGGSMCKGPGAGKSVAFQKQKVDQSGFSV